MKFHVLRKEVMSFLGQLPQTPSESVVDGWMGFQEAHAYLCSDILYIISLHLLL